MNEFVGEYDCKVDDKGRMVLPARFKSMLPDEDGNKMMLRKGLSKCIVMYTMSEWTRLSEKVAAMNEFVADQANFQRFFYYGAMEVELDKTGRFIIPKKHLKHADIDKDALVIGIGKRIEIWNQDLYEQFLEPISTNIYEVAAKVMGDQSKQFVH
jgi:MraZ protein